MSKEAQEKKAEAVAQKRLLSFDVGIESAISAFGLEKSAVVKAAGAKDFKELATWMLNVAHAAAQQQQQPPKK